MAMVDLQVRNFVQRFQDLWAGGFSAHLDLDCREGEAWVGLRLHLGRHRAGGGQQDRGQRGGHRRGGSYSRRLEKRAAMRAAGQAAGNVSETSAHAEQAVDVRQEVPAHAVGAGDRVVRAVEVDNATVEVVDSSEEVLGEAGDDMNAEKAFEAKEQAVENDALDATMASDDEDIAGIEMSGIVSCPLDLRAAECPAQPAGLDGVWRREHWCGCKFWVWECRTCGWDGMSTAKQEGCLHPYD